MLITIKKDITNCKLEPQIIMPCRGNNELSLLWFQKSNTYSIVGNAILDVIETFLYKTKADFFKYLNTTRIPQEVALEYYLEIKQWLEQVNSEGEDVHQHYKSKYLNFEQQGTNDETHSLYYCIYGKWIQINFPNHIIRDLVHPQLSHYEVGYNNNITYQVFDIICIKDDLVLYLNKRLKTCCDLRETHVFLGKFALQIVSLLHSKSDKDWLATFHASTIVKQDKAIMCIGKSGSGKSTLCSLLNQYGYDVLADDLTPMLSASLEVYRNPSAISIKKGAFNHLKPYVKGFEALATINNYKGDIKFLPANCDAKHKTSFKCEKIVIVNYNEEVKQACLEVVSKIDGLDILITESWVSEQPDHALQFLNWINTVTFYKLTYSKTKDAVEYFNSI